MCTFSGSAQSTRVWKKCLKTEYTFIVIPYFLTYFYVCSIMYTTQHYSNTHTHTHTHTHIYKISVSKHLLFPLCFCWKIWSKRWKDHCLWVQSNRWPLLRRQFYSHVTPSVLISSHTARAHVAGMSYGDRGSCLYYFQQYPTLSSNHHFVLEVLKVLNKHH